MATSAREARRRKIIERGSDRLALITGRIQSVPDDPQHLSLIDSSSLTFQDEGNVVTPICSDETLKSLGNEGTGPIPSLVSPTDQDSAELKSPLLSSIDHISAESRPPVMGSSTRQSSSLERSVESLPQKSSLWSPKQLSKALAATEITRLLCSVVFSMLIVAFPDLGFKILRPLYLLLVTNATVVIANLVSRQGTSPGREDRGGSSRSQSSDDNDWTEQLGKALEIGFLMKRVADSVFTDCAVYSVILVCGSCLADRYR